ncbi:hypothetical protein [Microbacterium sp. SS28]|uniref:hypothetical protein n=1 Tax=Microbacterium sp. SS28 TaxID=2919948 RepID=UPI001FA9908D|nr:hypothetical protein [Microbacterium sp. SS28]
MSGSEPAGPDGSGETEDRPQSDGPAATDELDATIRVSREAPDDATALARGRRTADPGATQPSSSEDGEPDAAPGPRRTTTDAEPDAPDDGSTMVARRESRRRAARGVGEHPAPFAGTSASDVPASLGRIARAPESAPPVYAPRAVPPVTAARSAPTPHPQQQHVDTASVEAASRRRARRRTVIALVAASVILAVVVAALIALTATA